MTRRAAQRPRARWKVGRRDETARVCSFRGTGWRSNYGSISGCTVDRKTERRGTRPPWVRSAERGYGYQCPPGRVNQPGAARCLPEADLLGHLDLDDLAVLDNQEAGPEPRFSKDIEDLQQA